MMTNPGRFPLDILDCNGSLLTTDWLAIPPDYLKGQETLEYLTDTDLSTAVPPRENRRRDRAQLAH